MGFLLKEREVTYITSAVTGEGKRCRSKGKISEGAQRKDGVPFAGHCCFLSPPKDVVLQLLLLLLLQWLLLHAQNTKQVHCK